MIKDRVGRDVNVGDFVIYVTAGDRHPVLEFGYVVKFHETKGWDGKGSGRYKIKLQRSAPNGTRRTVRVVDVPGHWREGTPPEERNWKFRDEHYVPNTYRDTGKPDTTMLDISLDSNNNRLMVTQPV